MQWNDTGQWLLSGSDDHRLIVTEPYTGKIRTDLMTSHRANIFSAKFLPGTSGRKIVSCAGDGTILFTGNYLLVENSFCHRKNGLVVLKIYLTVILYSLSKHGILAFLLFIQILSDH